jgi:hypothetical protein
VLAITRSAELISRTLKESDVAIRVNAHTALRKRAERRRAAHFCSVCTHIWLSHPSVLLLPDSMTRHTSGSFCCGSTFPQGRCHQAWRRCPQGRRCRCSAHACSLRLWYSRNSLDHLASSGWLRLELASGCEHSPARQVYHDATTRPNNNAKLRACCCCSLAPSRRLVDRC